MVPFVSPEIVLAARREMPREARRIVDAARDRGISLRLMGGIAVREHCRVTSFCERDYADLDVVGRRRHFKAITELFADLGYDENLRMRIGTHGRQLQFVRSCEHRDEASGVSLHRDDHVDVFLETFRMDHELDLRGRIEVGGLTLPAADLLLTKLQIHKTNEKDLRDVVTLLKDQDLSEGEGEQEGLIDVRYVARHCAADWGLYYDVMHNLELAEAALERYELATEERGRVRAAIGRVRRGIEEEPKSRAWRRRARVGTRKPWFNVVEDQEEEAA